MRNNQLDKAIKSLFKTSGKDIIKALENDIKFVPKDALGASKAFEAQEIINHNGTSLFQDEFRKAYLTTTQNLSYFDSTLSDSTSVFVILGGGDTVLEMLSRGILDITAADTNPMQSMIYHLKMAAFLSLNPNEFTNYILRSNSSSFLNPSMFKKIKDSFIDKEYMAAWEILFDLNEPSDIRDYLLKRIENLYGSYERLKGGLSYLSKDAYAAARENFEKAKITVTSEDAFTYLTNNPENKFDYIDLTNIVSGFCADSKEGKSLYLQRLASLIDIWENNLNDGGTMVFDYQFGITPSTYDEPFVSKPILPKETFAKIIDTYKQLYNYLLEHFEIEYGCFPGIIRAYPGKKDTVIYARKRA